MTLDVQNSTLPLTFCSGCQLSQRVNSDFETGNSLSFDLVQSELDLDTDLDPSYSLSFHCVQAGLELDTDLDPVSVSVSA